ncbi:ferrous iron transmembrane transporter [Malassezia pachydermatis]|uniref:High-affinity iron transporter n=1 Tax=Malassezia pachydermatis TaxID=77020 RepID=A0A0M8MKR9_9BASI|nr:high-affinity iron transporter [Malassezia pachydermatis]KOS14456.1 high-affinity iron transporter [Malassezia pachydermatis]
MGSGPTGNRVFAPTIFFIAFREALEAALVIGILTGMLERVVGKNKHTMDDASKKLIRKLRIYIIAGALTGLGIAFIIGAIFLAIFYTQTTDLYGRSEELWEGIFNLIAVVLITPMSLVILHADKSRAKWKKKLARAFNGMDTVRKEALHNDEAGLIQSTAKSEKERMETPETMSFLQKVHMWTRVVRKPLEGDAKGPTAIFVIPLVTTLREGLEGVVFIGGVSLGLPASSIPLPAIVGIFCGLLVGFIIFKARSISKIKPFLVFCTCALLIIAAGMFSRCVYYFQFYKYVQKVGDAAAESGSGPGSYNALDYVWHLDCCNPEDKTNNGGSGWSILNSLVGWNNTATISTILSYILYWIAIAIYLCYYIIKERNRKKKRTIIGQPNEATHDTHV